MVLVPGFRAPAWCALLALVVCAGLGSLADPLIASMTRAEARNPPVLRPLQDRVLFLKHNLNARAIGAPGNELATIRGNVDSLVAELEAAIKEADTSIKEMDAEQAATTPSGSG
jgi:hypothetical protein